MKKAIYPGTFDPPTLGHLNIIQRAAAKFDTLVVAIGENPLKKTKFSIEERRELLKTITADLSNVEVLAFGGLLVDFAKEQKIDIIVRAIRTIFDFESETLQAEMNRHLGGVETLYFAVDEKYRLISSTLIREIASHGKRLDRFIPKEIEEVVYRRLFKQL